MIWAMREFTWKDGERTIRFGRGSVATAPELIGTGYILLTTERARGSVPELEEHASAILDVPAGFVDEISVELLPQVLAARTMSGSLVAFGGGRVIDTGKAIAAATGRAVAAIPTTLSAAEMTWLHRHVKGLDPVPVHVRPRVVVNDPDVSASQPEAELAASAGNSLGHAVEAPLTIRATPVPTLAAREAARLTATAYAGAAPDREALALAALLSGYAIDSSWYGLHHVMSQTLVRVGGVGHGQANSALLPHTMRALATRGHELVAPVELAEQLAALAGATHLAAFGVDDAVLDECADAAAQRPELALTPPPADRDELRSIYAAAL
ncbi:MAG: maleylacetate reductase [Solirubrobacteraceae bacterium]|nr:maleylacetate reductase [Solirubrobacteraceae bacterium]